MFRQYSSNPVIPRAPETFFSIHAANPDLLEFNEKLFLYFRGQGKTRHDQIGIAYCRPEDFDGVNWKFYKKNPVIEVSSVKEAFDSCHILDPASIIINEKVYLYYSGHSYDKPPGIGLAVSDNGFEFIKPFDKPVIKNAIAPEVISHNGMVYLFYQRKEKNYLNFYCCTSKDGIYFNPEDERKVFSPSFKKGTFDEFSITTCRIWVEDNVFYMTYGGCSRFDDYPVAFGLARSTDLMKWDRYPDNPIMERGNPGEWDEGAVWFGTVYKHKDTYYLWYEGCGAGFGTDSEEAVEASRICREEDYGGASP